MARTAKIAGPSKGSAEFSRKYTMWATSDWSDMLVATKSDGNARTGFALVNGTLMVEQPRQQLLYQQQM